MKHVGTVSTNLFYALKQSFKKYEESLRKAQEKAVKKKFKKQP